MQPRFAVVLLLPLLACLADAGPLDAQDRGDGDNITYVNQRKFTFRYKLDKPRGRTIELRLYASRDGGPWVFSGKCLPTQPGFTFDTDQDGSYAFAVQAVYEGNQLDPPTNELKADRQRVVIDTQPPRGHLRAMLGAEGAAGVEWEVTDDNLDTNSIRLEYRWPDQAAWLPLDREVAFRPKDQRTWVLKPGQKLEVRLRALDMAKNELVTPGIWTPPEPGQNHFNDPGRDPSTPGPGGASRPTLFFVNHRRVKLEYDVKVGKSGLHHAELWYTTNGQDWKLDEKAADRPGGEPTGPVGGAPDEKPGKQALYYDAPADGLYGFIILAHNRAGVGPDKPRKGDPPRVQVMVDTEKPQVQLLSVKPRPNGDRGEAILDIAWSARDRNIAPQPITLEYAEDKNGQWRLIADRLDNTGRYTWTVGPNEPYQFYLRVKCVDRANNVGEATTTEPVIVDLTVPSVEIKDVGPGGR